MWETLFDIETKSWFDETGTSDPSDLGVSVVSVYHRQVDPQTGFEITGEMSSFWEHQLPDMWSLFRQADRIIGFNSLGFDVPVLRPYSPADFPKWPHFDIMDEVKKIVGRRVGLNAFAKDTLGRSKTDEGANAVVYWQKGDDQSLKLLKSYCEADVTLTRDIYDFAMKNKHLKYTDHWNNPRIIPVNFSYPQDFSPTSKQPSLF